MSIQQMPYPPYIKTHEGDIHLRNVITSFIVLAIFMPLYIEVTYAAKEKFIGINVSTLLHIFFLFMYLRDYCKVLFTYLTVHRF